MCRQAEVRRHDGLRAEGRSPYVGLRDSLRTAEKKMWGRKKSWGGRKEKLGGRKSDLAADHHIEAAPKKKKKTRFFRLGAEKYDFRAPKEQRPTLQRDILVAYLYLYYITTIWKNCAASIIPHHHFLLSP